MPKIPLVVVAGPTGVGKTETSIKIAKALDAEIISGDSMQIYKYMDIGTAKISDEEKEGVVHHLIDILHPSEDFSVCEYAISCKEKAEDIYNRGKLPIIVGGTGLYIDSVVDGITFSPQKSDEAYREYLKNLAETQGNEYVHSMLKDIDRESYEKIHPNNVKRVIRALEYYRLTGETISEHNEKTKNIDPPYNCAYIFLTRNRDELYQRIDRRVDLMLEAGLIDETKKLFSMGISPEATSMQAIGYKEIGAFLSGEVSLDEATDTLKKNSRHYAKRQITWFSRRKDAFVVNLSETDNPLEKCLDYIKNTLGKGEYDL